MCLAIVKPLGVVPNWRYLENGFKKNKDGAGFAVAVNGRVESHKGFFTFAEFRAAFEPHCRRAALIHFRWATHGKVDGANCHPFTVIKDRLAVIHNGVLNISTEDDKSKSDTQHFVDKVLRPMAKSDSKFHRRPHVQFLGEAAISGNKLCFIEGTGQHTIWNEKSGVWVQKIWYSNDGYAEPKVFLGFREFTTPLLERLEMEPKKDDVYDALTPEQRGHWNDLIDIHNKDEDELEDIVLAEGADSLHTHNMWLSTGGGEPETKRMRRSKQKTWWGTFHKDKGARV